MKKLIALLVALMMLGTIAAAAAETLTMGTNASFPPYEYYEDGKIVGIDAEIAAAIAEKLGMELEIMDMEFKAIIPAVTESKIDFGMAGMTVTEERLQSVNFSDTYATGIQAIIVKEDSEITCYEDLAAEGAEWKIGVQDSTTGDIYCTDEFGDERVSKYAVGADAVEALKKGKVDCVIIDNEPAKAYVEANEGLKILDSTYAEEEYAICVNLENTELLDKINAALKELIEDGTVASIIAKYIPAE
ncbi:MAG: transporter substrate-binding domain-containing protein [Clostridia bacterium]|nr:transporter substrate-binding domain-containing protein [Clostridia bacterium]MBR5962384.1 transporter substrate-binding domain-containing protein [Clostridia bacterium]